MSLQGNATGAELRGKINGLDVLCIDAYAVAVRNGFEGTVEEWLKSLKGDVPKKGIDYWTKEDIDQIKSYVDESIVGEMNIDELVKKANDAWEKANTANELIDGCEEAAQSAREAAQNLSLTHEDVVSGGYVEALKESNNGGKFKTWVGTKAEYDALVEKTDNTLYLVTDDTDAESITKNHIVELSTDGFWTWEKWSNGIVKCWGTITLENTDDSLVASTVACEGTVSIGETDIKTKVYYRIFSRKYPAGLFVNIPTVIATAVRNNIGAQTASTHPLKERCSAVVWGGKTGLFGVSIYAVGNWK
jgi:hypothetical protein